MNEHYKRFTERTESELRTLISFFGKLRNKTPNQYRQFQAMQVAWLQKRAGAMATIESSQAQAIN